MPDINIPPVMCFLLEYARGCIKVSILKHLVLEMKIIVWGIKLKMKNNTEMSRWRWYAMAVTVLGIIIYSLPWLSSRTKILLTIPLYALFVYVYYNYICLKKKAQAAVSAKDDIPDMQKTSSEQNANKKAIQKGKTTGKKGR